MLSFCNFYIINKQEVKLQKLEIAVLLAYLTYPTRASSKIIVLLAFKARVEQ